MRSCVIGALFAGVIGMSAANASDPCGKGKLIAHRDQEEQTLFLQWSGAIEAPMHERIAAEFDTAKRSLKEVILALSSCGGSMRELDEVTKVLRRIREKHRLATWVGPGSVCASACVPLFLQGQRRSGALTSSWLFHEVGSVSARDGSRVRVDRARTEMIYQDYFRAAGVSEAWLNQLRMRVQHANYWQTGENLWEEKSGIITHPIENLQPRGSEESRY
jgi:hypothetical protein